jgi:hypothetical protein
MGYMSDALIYAIAWITRMMIGAYVEPFARWAVGRAVDRLPPDHRRRFREEWLAHLQELPSPIPKLWHALGCYVGAAKVSSVLAKERERNERVVILKIMEDLIFDQGLNGISAILPESVCKRLAAKVQGGERGDLMPVIDAEYEVIVEALKANDWARGRLGLPPKPR